MLKVGLTGSIAVGKSYVCGILRDLGCHVLDADQTAREVVSRGSAGLDRIVAAFGAEVLTRKGDLNRRKLGTIVFSDEKKRELLNSIVHPLVIDAQDRWLSECEEIDPDGIAVVDAALMIESGGYSRFDKLIVVWSKPAIQLKRLMLRDKLTREEAEKRIASQMPQDEKKQFGDLLIDTSGDFEETRRQTVAVYEKLRLANVTT